MSNILRLIKLAKPLYKFVFIIAALILTTAVLQQLAPIISKFIVDEIVLQIDTGEGSVRTIGILIGLSFTISFISTIITSLSQRLGDHFSGEMRKYLTEKFYDKVLQLPQSYFDSEISGKIINQLNRGIFTIQNFINTSTNFILPTIVQSFFTIFILLYYNIPTGLFLFSLFPIYIVLTQISAAKWGKKEVIKNKHEDNSRGRIQEAVSNIKLVKAFTNEMNEWKYVSGEQKSINDVYAKQSQTFHIYDFIRNLSLIVILLIINIIVFYNTFQGNLTIGEMVLIIQLVFQARRPLFAMSFILTQLQLAEKGSKEYFEILALDSQEDYSIEKEKLKITNPKIKFDNVSFQYDSSQEVLHKVNFEFKPNEKIALVGHSGAGKSTIINLILKLYDPTNGDILINDKKYSELTHHQVRDNITLVFQENELFSSTIRENVSYGKESTDEEIIDALKKAHAFEFVSKLKDGINSEVGERGVRLSGGQKQRIQIARAILSDKPILILDEATSNLDSKSEVLVQQAIETLIKNKLVIIIAHRFSTIQNVDRIIVIDNGNIVDSGSPKELSQKQGIYSELLRYQVEGNKKLLKHYELY